MIRHKHYWLLLALVCSQSVGCMLPALSKLAKPRPQHDNEHFACGESCPPGKKEVTRSKE